MSALLLLPLAAALAPPASAQVAAGAAYELLADGLSGAAGGLASPGFAAHVELGVPAAPPLASASYSAELGFLAGNDPAPTNAPVLFGVAPGHGSTDGGTPLAISGVHFDHLGAGATLYVEVGGALATDVVVASDTQLTAVAPSMPSGPSDVAVTTVHGTGVLPGGFVGTPAVLASPGAMVGGSIVLQNLGPVGAVHATYWSDVTTFLPIPGWGDLLIGPAPLVPVVESATYPAPEGIATLELPVPANPLLVGLVVHFQSVAVTGGATPGVELTNRASTVLK